MKFANTLFAVSAFAMALVGAEDLMSVAKLRIKPDGYSELPEELRTWLESEAEADKQLTKHVSIQEVEGQGNPMMVFQNAEGKDMETVFVSYIPLDMVQSLVKEKKWVDAGEEKKSDEL